MKESANQQTPSAARVHIITELQSAQSALMRAAACARECGYHERAHKILNYAQSVSCAIGLVEEDWKQEDAT